MFEDSLLESGGRLTRRNPWSITISFAAQAAFVGAFLLLSLIYTDVLPVRTLINTLEAPPPAASAAAPVQAVRTTTAPPVSELHNPALMAPSRIPQRIATGQDERVPPDIDTQMPPGVLHGIGSGPSIIGKLLPPVPAPPTRAESPRKVPVSSGVAQGLLIRQIKPQYPPLALQARVQGTVVLQAVIGTDGSVQQLRVVSGHPLLTGAALAAVKQWRYRPYYLNGEPVAVDTQINVNFTLAGE